jgi:hypothetical protein
MKVIVSTGALVLGFALTSASALAQNIQGPAAPNFGLISGPQTGATTNAAPNAGFQSSHIGGFGGPTFYRAPSLPPPVFNQANPYTVPQSPETPVSPAGPGSIFGDR